MAAVCNFQLKDTIFVFVQNVECVKGSFSCGKIKVGGYGNSKFVFRSTDLSYW